MEESGGDGDDSSKFDSSASRSTNSANDGKDGETTELVGYLMAYLCVTPLDYTIAAHLARIHATVAHDAVALP